MSISKNLQLSGTALIAAAGGLGVAASPLMSVVAHADTGESQDINTKPSAGDNQPGTQTVVTDKDAYNDVPGDTAHDTNQAQHSSIGWEFPSPDQAADSWTHKPDYEIEPGTDNTQTDWNIAENTNGKSASDTSDDVYGDSAEGRFNPGDADPNKMTSMGWTNADKDGDGEEDAVEGPAGVYYVNGVPYYNVNGVPVVWDGYDDDNGTLVVDNNNNNNNNNNNSSNNSSNNNNGLNDLNGLTTNLMQVNTGAGNGSGENNTSSHSGNNQSSSQTSTNGDNKSSSSSNSQTIIKGLDGLDDSLLVDNNNNNNNNNSNNNSNNNNNNSSNLNSGLLNNNLSNAGNGSGSSNNGSSLSTTTNDNGRQSNVGNGSSAKNNTNHSTPVTPVSTNNNGSSSNGNGSSSNGDPNNADNATGKNAGSGNGGNGGNGNGDSDNVNTGVSDGNTTDTNNGTTANNGSDTSDNSGSGLGSDSTGGNTGSVSGSGDTSTLPQTGNAKDSIGLELGGIMTATLAAMGVVKKSFL